MGYSTQHFSYTKHFFIMRNNENRDIWRATLYVQRVFGSHGNNSSSFYDVRLSPNLSPDPFPTKETNYWPNVEIFSELAGSVHDTRHRKYKYEKGQSGIGIKWLAKRTNLENASSLAHNVSIVRSQAMPPIVDDFSNFFSFYFFLFPFR